MLNQDIRDNAAAIAKPPFAEATKATTQNIPNNATTLLTWTAEVTDTDAMINLGANASRMVASSARIFATHIYVGFAAAAGTAWTELELRVNGAVAVRDQLVAHAGAGIAHGVFLIQELAVGEYFETAVKHVSGGARLTAAPNRWATCALGLT